MQVRSKPFVRLLCVLGWPLQMRFLKTLAAPFEIARVVLSFHIEKYALKGVVLRRVALSKLAFSSRTGTKQPFLKGI